MRPTESLTASIVCVQATHQTTWAEILILTRRQGQKSAKKTYVKRGEAARRLSEQWRNNHVTNMVLRRKKVKARRKACSGQPSGACSPEQAIEAADEAADLGDVPQAIEILKQALGTHPNNSLVRLWRDGIENKLGQKIAEPK